VSRGEGRSRPQRPAHAAARAAAIACLLGSTLVTLGGCGVRSADLFLVERTGTIPGARLTLLVSEDGRVSCDGRAAGRLSDAQLVRARGIQEDLQDPASRRLTLPPRPGSVLRYVVRQEGGTVRFSDNSAGQPPALRQLALLVLQIAQGSCHLPQ
jgi:hypothetical protein